MKVRKEIVKSKYANELAQKIKQKTAIVGVIGLGYVGLPNVITQNLHNYKVIGFDTDLKKVDLLNSGKSYIKDVSSDQIEEILAEDMFYATNDLSKISEVDIILIDLPTPLIEGTKLPDHSYIESAANTLCKHARSGQLIILESTVAPNTTRDLIVEKLRDKELFIAYSPERISPNSDFDFSKLPRVVGADDPNALKLASLFMGDHAHKVNSLLIAELAKLYENTFRFINIAFANDFAKFTHEMGVNANDVINAASSKPFGFMPFYPNSKIGGHCIPIDPYYLLNYAEEKYKNKNLLSIIEKAGKINDSMFDLTISRILKENPKTVAIIGVAYKPDISDSRESLGTQIAKTLSSKNIEVTIFDSIVYNSITDRKVTYEHTNLETEHLDYEKLGDFDLVVVALHHTTLNLQKVNQNSKRVIDLVKDPI
ncbi:UDP-N-acetyl-D-glucosamine dehydrogenase [Actinomycetota bacterium]|nr:UDP-N-acetyl-D-glucosamine dehydrogenase [Actinomycetota bacterium]